VTKKELIVNIADAAGVSKAVAEKALNAVIDGISDALSNREKVTFVGFGTFYVSKRPARKGRNPKTGSPINIPASTVPKFKPGKALKETVA
jgi:DNA-binding protein HU-beta